MDAPTVMNYTQYKYIFPPRPEITIAPASLDKFSTGEFIAQPKMNGSLMEVYTDGTKVVTMNRHKEPISHKMNIEELKSLHRGNGWMVLCGEYMNKNKKDEDDQYWNIKYVIFDIIVYEGNHLLKTSFDERFELLRKLYTDNPVKKHLHQVSENCFRVSSMRFGLRGVFDEITQYDMYEGLVLKKGDGLLENGTTQKNNVRTQLKCRKPTKNYAF